MPSPSQQPAPACTDSYFAHSDSAYLESAYSESAFSATTRHRLSDLYPNQACWHCNATPADPAQVIMKRDPQFNAFKSAGLLTIDSLSDVQNAVLLCPLCDRNFNDYNSPGFVFFPTDLDYFRQHEERDAQRRRERYRITGTRNVRMPPSVWDYLNHQRANGLVDEESVGGIYERYTLRDYFPSGMSFISPGPRLGQVARPAPWHGDPMAAFRRAFAAISSPIRNSIPLERKRELMGLKQLYEETDASYQAIDPPVDEASPSEDGDTHGRQTGGTPAREAPSPGPGGAPNQPPAREGGDAATDAARSTSRHHRTTAVPPDDPIPTPPCCLSQRAEPASTSAPADSDARAAQTAAIVPTGVVAAAAQRTADNPAFQSNEKKRSRHPTAHGNDEEEEAPRAKRPKAVADTFFYDPSRPPPESASISNETVVSKTQPPHPHPPQGWRWGPDGTARDAIDFYVDLQAVTRSRGRARPVSN